MYSENRFPVKLYEGGPVGYAKGGLHDEALAVRRAGRNGDGRLVHVNDEEFAEMVAEYGEPTINPETGMPEFFLGKLLKVLKVVAPIALNFIPGVGPLASAAVGAALGATGGGGLKGALLGGALGGLGAGGAGGIGAKLGTTVLGTSVAPRVAQALGSAALGAGASAALGADPLSGALSVGLGNYMRNPMSKGIPSAPTPTAAPAASAPVSAGFSVTPENGLTLSPEFRANLSNIEGLDLDPISTAPVASAPVKFMNRDFLGIKGLPNKYGIGASALAAAAAYDLLKPKSKINEQTPEEFFGPAFSGSGGQPAGGFRLASNPMPQSTMSEYERRYLSGYAGGGNVSGGGRSAGRSFAVEGRGTGRSDEIPAMLSDGEYVMDAETVAMLGDGSSKAGAKKLDDFRVKIRKQKGKKLAKGKISQDAKRPERYMAGGRI
jgi:hypothetical protein